MEEGQDPFHGPATNQKEAVLSQDGAIPQQPTMGRSTFSEEDLSAI